MSARSLKLSGPLPAMDSSVSSYILLQSNPPISPFEWERVCALQVELKDENIHSNGYKSGNLNFESLVILIF